MFFRAQTTARTQKRQVRVLRSKYSKYAASGGTKKQVTRAATRAMDMVAFFFKKAKHL
jgi:hypothetical protein